MTVPAPAEHLVNHFAVQATAGLRLAAVQIRNFCLCCLIGLGFLPDNLFSCGFNGAVRAAALPIRVSAGAVHGT